MKYYDIIMTVSNDLSEEVLQGIHNVSDFLEKIREKHPEKVGKFLESEYIRINGKHFNEPLARKVVSEMFHIDKNGQRVEGEAITPSEAQELLQGKSAEKSEKLYWDAYVAANGFMHDVSAKAGISKSDNARLAREFWFNDDDKEDKCHKVYWYYLEKQF